MGFAECEAAGSRFAWALSGEPCPCDRTPWRERFRPEDRREAESVGSRSRQFGRPALAGLSKRRYHSFTVSWRRETEPSMAKKDQGKAKGEPEGIHVVARNRKARHEY